MPRSGGVIGAALLGRLRVLAGELVVGAILLAVVALARRARIAIAGTG